MTTEKKTKKSKTNPKGAKVTKEFMFKLTVAEKADRGEAIGALDNEIDELELRKKESVDNWNAKIRAREAKRKEISAVLHAKEEKRTIEAVLVHNYAEGTIEYWFEGEIMESRTMTDNERQKEMDLKAPKKPRATKQTLQKHDPVAEAHASGANGKLKDIAEVHKLETSRGTKTSAVDGPTRQ